MIKQALISVSDKKGILEFAKTLHHLGVQLLSTGGTAQFLAEANLPVTEVSDYTGFPEILDGRVKTLHPKIHAGLLAKRDLAEHQQALAEHGIPPIDLLVVNLYPFEQTIAQENCSFQQAIEQIDIGGPTMLRAAAKNHQHITVIVDPEDYTTVLAEMAANGNKTSDATRFELACKVFTHTAHYDSAIANYLVGFGNQHQHKEDPLFPQHLHLGFNKVQDLRYGENPHQKAAFYRDLLPPPGTLANYRQLQGKALSYNNIADADTAWECVKTLDMPACVIVKHANPCGVALGTTAREAYQRAFSTDPTSAFGGIIALNYPCDEACAQAITQQFVEVLIAPEFTPEAQLIFSAKENLRLLEIPHLPGSNLHEYKRVGGGLLIQTTDQHNVLSNSLKIVSKRQPTPEQLDALLFSWRVAKFVKSNAVVFCNNYMTLGIGAGQMSRVDAARIAQIKAQNAHLSLSDSVVASDAFFPFRDGVDTVVAAGACGIIHPGGSIRDEEVIAAADEHDIVMVLTGIRHFRH